MRELHLSLHGRNLVKLVWTLDSNLAEVGWVALGAGLAESKEKISADSFLWMRLLFGFACFGESESDSFFVFLIFLGWGESESSD